MKLYQILIFNKIPKIFFYESKNFTELLVDNEYVCVYKEGKPYYYQKLDSCENLAELKSFIEKNLNLENLNIVKSDLIKFNKKINYSFFKPVKSNIFKFFVLYMIFLCFGFYFFEFQKVDNEDQLNMIQNNTIALKRNIKFEAISDDIVFLYEKAKDNGLEINSLSFKESKFFLTIKSKNKQNIYEFLKTFDGNIINIVYDEKIKEYFANASFKVYRR